MPRLNTIDPEAATGQAETLLQTVKTKMGMVPNMTRIMANAPSVLETYLQMSGTLASGSMDPELREKLSLLAAQANGCGYCLSAHTAVGKMIGVPATELDASRRGESDDDRHRAALEFAQRFLDTKGAVSDEALAEVRSAGFSDGEIAEIAAQLAASIFTNYFNRLVQPDLDFPQVSA